MEEWKEYKLAEVCTKITDGSHSSPKAQESGYPMFSVKDMFEYGFDYSKCKYISQEDYVILKKNGCVPQKGDVLVAKDGSYLKQIFVCKETKEEAILSSIAIFRPNSLVDSFFLSYLLKSPQVYNYIANNCVSGSALPRIVLKDFKEVKLPIPSIEIQKSIVSILKSLDDKIEVNRRINDNLEQQAQALFKSWFVDFEPFKDGEFVESELGMIPKGWRIGTFLDNIKVMPGGTPSTSRNEYWDDGTIPFFSPKDVNGVYCFETEKSITELGLNNCSSNLYPKDTLFITARGTVGKLTLAGVPMAMNQSNYALVTREGIGKYYLYLITQTLVSVLLKKANGAVFSAITTRDFNEPTLMPAHNDLMNFELLVTPLFNKIFQTSVESRRLAELRDALLPKLMSGELKVNEVEI